MADLPEEIKETVGAQLAPGETARAGYVQAEDDGEEAHVVTDRRVIGVEIDRNSGKTVGLSHYLLTDDRIFGATYEEETSMSEWIVIGALLLVAGLVFAAGGTNLPDPFTGPALFIGMVIALAGAGIVAAAWGNETTISVKVHSTAQSKEWTVPPEGEDLAREIAVVVGEKQS